MNWILALWSTLEDEIYRQAAIAPRFFGILLQFIRLDWGWRQPERALANAALCRSGTTTGMQDLLATEPTSVKRKAITMHRSDQASSDIETAVSFGGSGHEGIDFEDPEFVEKLWRDYYPKLKSSLVTRVRAMRQPVMDESEIALSALHSFVRRVRDGQFPDLEDHDSLWRLLRTIAIRKANDTLKRLKAIKRGGQQVIHGQADLERSEGQARGIQDAAAPSPPPSFELELSDLFNTLLAGLPDDRSRDCVLLKLQGAPLTVIAECLQTSTRTVQRLLRQIEEQWQAEAKGLNSADTSN